jgi:fatty-acyl-CoA synthase
LLIRNHRWFLVALYGSARVGAKMIFLNSEFSGPQIKEVSEREGAKLIIYDDEYADAVSSAETPRASCARSAPIRTSTSRRAPPTRRWPSWSRAAAGPRPKAASTPASSS